MQQICSVFIVKCVYDVQGDDDDDDERTRKAIVSFSIELASCNIECSCAVKCDELRKNGGWGEENKMTASTIE